jgi:hypothetical protein
VLDFLKLIRQYRSTLQVHLCLAGWSWHEPSLRPALLFGPCVHTNIACGPRFFLLPIPAHGITLLFCTAHAMCHLIVCCPIPSSDRACLPRGQCSGTGDVKVPKRSPG